MAEVPLPEVWGEGRKTLADLGKREFCGFEKYGGGRAEAMPGHREQSRARKQSAGWVRVLHRQGPRKTVSKGCGTVSGAEWPRVLPHMLELQSLPWPGWPTRQPCSPAVREVTLPIWVSTANRS